MRPSPAAMGMFSLLLLALTLYSNLGLLPSSPSTYATTQNITLNGSAGTGWNDFGNGNPGPTITVTENDFVNASLTSTDGALHQFYLDTNGSFDPSGDCNPTVDKCSGPFGGTNPKTIQYSFNVDFPAGTYTFYCAIHPFMMGTFKVQGFRLSSIPNSMIVLRGSSAMSTIALTSFNGFTGNASLSTVATGGLIPSLNSTTVSLASGGTSGVSLTVNVPPTTSVGIYNVLLKATIGSISHTTNIAIVVKKPGFSLSSSLTQLVILQGSSKATNITLRSLNTFNGIVGLSNSTLPGVTVAFAPPSVMLTSGQSATSVLNVTVASLAISGEYNLTLTGTSGPDTNTTKVDLVVGRDFTVTASSLNLIFPQGSSGASIITLASVNGFQGNVSLSSPNTLVGIAISFNTTSVSLTTNQTAYANVTVSASQSTAPKVYSVAIRGTNSSRVRSVNLNVTVSGFTIQTSIASFDLTQGKAGSSAITLTSINGFSGTMSLTVTGGSALTRSLALSSALLNANENLTVTLGFSASAGAGLTPPGSYVFNVTGTVGSLAHSTTVTVTVTALPPSEAFPTVLVAGVAVSLVAVLSIVLFMMKRRGVKAKGSSVPQSK